MATHCSEDLQTPTEKPPTQNSNWSQDLFGCVVRPHVVFLLCKDDVEDGVGAAAGLVHVGRSHSAEKGASVSAIVVFFFFWLYSQIYASVNSPGFVPRVHQILDVIVRCDSELGEVLDVGPHQGMFTDTQVAFVLGIEQVPHALAVDLHVTHLAHDGKINVVTRNKDKILFYFFCLLETSHLHRVRHAVVIVAFINLGEKILTQL